MRKKFLYRVTIDSMPEGMEGYGPDDEGKYFVYVSPGWVRHYQSKTAADHRVDVLRDHKITAHVDRSDPITWGES